MGRRSWLILPFITLSLAAQAPAPQAHPAANGHAPAAPALDPQDPKPYEKVITGEARTSRGLIQIHQVKGRLYFEIPTGMLGRELLLAATMTQAPAGVDHAGRMVHSDVVRFVRQDNKVYLQTVSHALASDPARPIAPAVAASQRDAIIQAFNVEAVAKDGSPVVEVTRLFTTENGDFTARQALNAQMLDASRSYVETAKAFPASVRVDAVQTYTMSPFPAGLPTIPGMPAPAPRSGSVVMSYSLVSLPDKAMQPRVFDDRVGFFTIGQRDYGSDAHEAPTRQFITRWRLEKKDPAAAVSEPVKPIVWYIDRATPAAWVPYVKKGVEAWNVAFEAAGFRNAVQARLFPTREEDPEFDPEDVRYSIIRWVPSPVTNAYGPHLSDPRSGEILNANIILYHNIMQLQRDWYFTQAGPLDKRAAHLPLPDDLMGELLAYVVTHECGHSLGFQHNMKASSTYPFEKLRDKAWLKEMGHVSTLMDYSRFNYVVQPEDGIDPELLRPRIGPYDVFAVKWGYTPIPEAAGADAEKPVLDAWARAQDATPWLRFSTPRANGSDSGENTEAVGDADAVKATALGTKNLQRVVAMLPAAAAKAGDSDETLQHMYGAVWSQWSLELGHVAAIVGGYQTQNKHQGQAGEVYTPETRARQEEAVRFIGDNLFRTPKWILARPILDRMTPGEGARRLLSAQRRSLRILLQDRARTNRLQEHEALLGDKAYRLQDLLADLRAGVFSELSAPGARIDTYRRNLQRAFLEVMDDRLNQAAAPLPAVFGPGIPVIPDDARGAVTAELKAIQSLAAARAAAAGDKATRAHLEDLKAQIARILDPRLPHPPAPPQMPVRNALDCWPEYD